MKIGFEQTPTQLELANATSSQREGSCPKPAEREPVNTSKLYLTASLLALGLLGCTSTPTSDQTPVSTPALTVSPSQTPAQQAMQTPPVDMPAPTATPVLLLTTEDGETDVEPLAENIDAPTPDQQKMLDKIATDMIVDSPQSLLERGEVYLMAGEQGIDPAYALGIADLTEVLKDQPDHPIALRYRGMAYTRTGKLEEAIADHQKLMEVKPNDPYAYIVCASLLTESGKDDDAIAVYDTVLELGGESAESARFNRGQAYMRQNKKDLAREDFQFLAENAKNDTIQEESKQNLEKLGSASKAQ